MDCCILEDALKRSRLCLLACPTSPPHRIFKNDAGRMMTESELAAIIDRWV